MNATTSLRQQLAELLTWSDAHINFDDAVAGLPVAARGKVPKGLPVLRVAARRAHATRTSRYFGVLREPTIQGEAVAQGLLACLSGPSDQACMERQHCAVQEGSTRAPAVGRKSTS